MATQLIMTVGTNALPVWVAWHHLKDKLEQPVSVRFVYTNQTKVEMKKLNDVINSDCPGISILNAINVDPGEPKSVQNEITRNIIDSLNDNTKIHIHYTGGTKAMVVESVSTIERKLASTDKTINASYLNPRGDIGPKIVSRTKLRVKDTRKGIIPDINRIAHLNGIKFIAKPSKPNERQIKRGKSFLNDGWPPAPKYRESKESEGAVLEYGTYAAFHQALTKKGIGDWDLFIGTKGVRINRPGEVTVAPRSFELDVIAVLGYQVILVSCYTGKDSKEIKMKAMEAIIRAKQLGGEEAQTITLCSANNRVCAEIQAGLQDEMGGDSPYLRVWGESKSDNLPNFQGLTGKFNTYLEDLKW